MAARNNKRIKKIAETNVVTTFDDDLDASEITRQNRVAELIQLGKNQVFYDLTKLQDFAEKAYELAAQPNSEGIRDEHGMAGAIALLSSRLISLDSFKEALEQATTGLAFLDPDKPDVYRAELISVMGESRFFMGEIAEGLSLEDEALKLFRELNQKIDEARILSALAVMHFIIDHREVAFETAEQAVRICRDLQNPIMLQLLLNNMALMYLEDENVPPALESAQEALEICELHHCTNESAVLDTIATIYLKLENLELAEKYARKSIEKSQTAGNSSSRASAEVRLSQVYAARGDLDEAIAHANVALEVKNAVEKKAEMSNIHQLLSELHEQHGEYAKSLDHMKKLYELEKDKAKHNTDSRVTELRVQHRIETAKKDSEIYRLRAVALEGEIEERRLDQIKLETENSLDPATGLFNRRHLPVLKDRFHIAHLEHSPTSLIMLDIDHFKKVNDTYGHLAGDRVIVVVTQILRSNIRDMDVALRFGGEEFLVYMADTNIQVAVGIAEKVRKLIEQTSISYADKIIPVTVSMGIAISSDEREEELRSLIDHADQALYRAKESGRNRVEMQITKH